MRGGGSCTLVHAVDAILGATPRSLGRCRTGIKVRDIKLRSLREQFSIVLQARTALVAAPISDNQGCVLRES